MSVPIRDPDKAGTDLSLLLKGRVIDDISFCPGDDDHGAHMDIMFTDGEVLELSHTLFGLIVHLLRAKPEGADERHSCDYHQQPEGLM